MSKLFEETMSSGKNKLAIFHFFSEMNDLIELSKGVPVPFSEVGKDDSDEGVIWYDDKHPRILVNGEGLRKYPIVEMTELDDNHHDIISCWGTDWNTTDPLYGLTISLVFDDSKEAKEADNEWYIEVIAADDAERRFYLEIKGGEYRFM